MKRVIKKLLTQIARFWAGFDASHRAPELEPTLWGLAYSTSEQLLSFDGHTLDAALNQIGSPMHLVLEKRLLDNLRAFENPKTPNALSCEVILSYKTNPVPGVLKVLHREAAGADVISAFELELAFRLGVPPQKIVYNGPAKSDESLEAAIAKGILAININHEDEVPRITQIARRIGKVANVGIRVTGSGWAGQFGFPAVGSEAIATIESIKQNNLLNLVALHCHRGHAIRSRDDVIHHVNEIMNFVERAKYFTGWTPEVIDLGGSLAIPTVRAFSAKDLRWAQTFSIPSEPPVPRHTLGPQSYSEVLLANLEQRYSRLKLKMPRVIIEPGRALTGNAQMLLCRVVDIKSSNDLNYAILEVGSSHARIMADEFHTVFPLKLKDGLRTVYRMVGPTCHTGDVVHRAWLSQKLQRGDGLAIMDSGAYFSSDAASFSFPRPGVALLRCSGELNVIRKTETFGYLTGLDTCEVGEGVHESLCLPPNISSST